MITGRQRGWIGIDLESVSDEELSAHILEAWRLLTPKKPAPKKRRAP